MLRRDFLKRLTATAAGLLVADDVLELIAEPRRLWPGADFGNPRLKLVKEIGDLEIHVTDAQLHALMRKIYADFRPQTFPTVTPLLGMFERRPDGPGLVWGGDVAFDPTG